MTTLRPACTPITATYRIPALPMSRLFAVALLTLATVANAIDRSPAEDARIEYLLTVVASLPDAQFHSQRDSL